MHSIIFSVVVILIYTNAYVIPNNYEKERTAFLEEESQHYVGGKLHLTEEELIANEILMKLKHKELDESFKNPQYFNFSKHYFTYKNNIEQSNVYQIIKKMPKGGVLHVHSSLMLDPSVIVKITYMDNLYACLMNGSIRLHFSVSTPQRPCSYNGWTLVSELRQQAISQTGNATSFDKQLEKYFTLYKGPGINTNTDINTIWRDFDEVYYAIKSLIGYRPAREIYWYETLKKFYEDNVMYIEVRSGLHSLYDIDGTRYDKKYMLDLYKRITEKFIEDHPDFVGVKIIVTRHRTQGAEQVLEALNYTKKLKEEMPDMIAGFDLVGQEDLGKPLIDFLPMLSEAGKDLNYYLHAGETSWLGTTTDENLVDAIILGSKRIGHGYALAKHPALLSAVMKRNIAIEVNVISNVVLSLVNDVRNHPLALYLAMGLPIVISSDDPGAWSAEPLSHDYFVTFMGVASKRADLRLLKQLALNSITYSALSNNDKVKFYSVFDKQWGQFIKDVISTESWNEKK